MRKLLVVLALVLCMALPAAANTWTTDANTTQDQLKTAVIASTDVDTIIIGANISLDATEQGGKNCGLYISSDRLLTLHIKEGCTLSVSSDAQELSGIYTEGNLTIEGSGKITAHSSNYNAEVDGVCAASGDVIIRNSVKIAADGDDDVNGIVAVAQSAQQNVNVTIQDSVSITASGSYNCTGAYGIYAYTDGGNAEVTIQDSANITASSSSAGAGVYGIYTCVGDAGSFGVTVQNGVVSGALHNDDYYNGTITINGGKFTENLGASIDGVNVSGEKSHEGDYWIVRKQTNLSFGENPVSVKQGANRDVAVIISGDSKLIESGVDITGISSDTAVSGLTVTSKDSAIHIAADTSCVPGTYTFNIKAQTEAYGYYSASGDLKITVTSADTPGPQPEPTPTPTPAPVEPVVSKDQLPENVVPAEATTSISVDEVAQVISSDFTSSDLTKDNSNKVIVKPDVAAEAIGNTLGKEVASDDILCFPVVSAYPDDATGKTIMFTFAVSGDQLTYASSDPSKLCVYKLLNSEKAEAFTYAASPSEAADKTFTVQNEDGTDAATIEKGKTYLVSAYVKDNGTFDLDHNENGGIIDPIAIDTSGTTPSSGSASNGGCNAGFAGLALAAFALLAAKRRKK